MKCNSREEFDQINVFGTGMENTAYAHCFVGSSYIITGSDNCCICVYLWK